LKNIDAYYIGDYADSLGLLSIFEFRPDIIVHCAGTSLVGPSIDDPGEYYNNNIAKTIKLLNCVTNFEKKPLIMFSSSASVYGEPDHSPITENARKNPISPYGNTKAMTETMLKDYWGAYAVPSVCFRYFNAAGSVPDTYDLGQEPDATHIIARVLEASIAGSGITINGENFDTHDGTCIRDYVHVWDIARAHVMAADHHYGYASAVHRIYNLGTSTGVSNREIVDYVAEKYGLTQIDYGQRRIGDPPELVADAKFVEAEIGWRPEYSDIATIIDSAYKWYAGRLIEHANV
jgi:UDP-arabinose 4-epimerase